MNEEELNIKIAQYRELGRKWNVQSQLIWQIPSIVIVISGVLLGIAFHIDDNFIRGIIVLITAFWVLTMIIFLVKTRMFQDYASLMMEKIEKEWKDTTPSIDVLFVETGDVIDFLENKGILKRYPLVYQMKHQSACRFLVTSCFLWFILLLYLGMSYLMK